MIAFEVLFKFSLKKNIKNISESIVHAHVQITMVCYIFGRIWKQTTSKFLNLYEEILIKKSYLKKHKRETEAYTLFKLLYFLIKYGAVE